jgi:hypothetical protein
MFDLGCCVVGAVGLGGVGQQDTVMSKAFFLHVLVELVEVRWLQWDGPKVGGGVALANKDGFDVLGDTYFASIERGYTSLVT